ncbi:MAG: DUF5009 domain-containing protein [Flavobacteriaceae bacterium]
MKNVSLENKRILSIDVLRGITILVMIWVNEMSSVINISPLMKHMPADADKMTFVDVVFPGFLFLVGMSIPFAINHRLLKGDSKMQLYKHILIRTIGLLVLGIFMVNGGTAFDESQMIISIALWNFLAFVFAILIWNMYPKTMNETTIKVLKVIGIVGLIVLFFLYKGENGNMMQVHWWGILGLIGLAYFFSSFIYIFSKGNLILLISAIVLLTGFFALGKTKFPSLSFMMSLEHATHSTITLSGVVVSLLFFNKKISATLMQRVKYVVGFVLALLLAGFLLRPYFTISKIWATPTWCFYSVGIMTALFLVLYYVLDVKNKTNWSNWMKPAATNPLLIYILPYILISIQKMLGFSIVPEFATSGIQGILWTFGFALLMVWVVKWFNKFNIRLHL